MARADLLKKLFSSYKQNDTEMFYSVASEIIEDEKKKNHGILADDLKLILNGKYQGKKPDILSFGTPKDKDKDMPLIEVLYPEKYFSDLIVTDDKIQQLEQIIKEFNNWDVLVSNGVFPTRRVLFYGPPGCGKTLAAQALAGEIGIPMLYVRFDALISSYLGETASNIRKVFEYAQKDSWVIFFDEFDAIGRSRNDSTEHGEIKRVVNAFLQQIDNYHGHSLIIAATNFEQSLDYAIWRRFDETMCFEMPSNEEKIKLFSLKMKRFQGPVHVIEQYMNELDAFSHSDIEKISQIIMKQCILEGRKIYSKNDIENAVKKQEKNVSLRKTQY
ncbi:MAG: AAA family ATPase [Lachnospiraceae bacterium]|jgi:AAA+ superfamily predicted ATPase|nr:AAA family ATPase [Lachnospiraceae bacterium]